jgi:glycosyltransferase involved in cell wall biosynthesis
LRIAFLSSTPASPVEGSGTFVGLRGLLQGLAVLGHDVTFRPLGLRTRFHTLDRWLYNAQVALTSPRADLVVGVDLDGFLWARRRRQRFVVALKGVIADELRNERGLTRALLSVQARWERLNVQRGDRVVVPSAYSAAMTVALYGAPPDKVRVVPEPIDLAGWRARLAAVPPSPSHPPTVLAVARMYPRKRLEDLLAAAARLRERIRDVRFRIVGDGPEAARLRALHARLGLGDTVRLLGDVSAATLAVEYVGADCFCLPSTQEGFGIVFLEAMTAGLPIVACRAAAVPEVVVDGENGVLVAPRDPEALARALETVLGDPARAKQLGVAGTRRVTMFDLEPIARRFLEAAA